MRGQRARFAPVLSRQKRLQIHQRLRTRQQPLRAVCGSAPGQIKLRHAPGWPSPFIDHLLRKLGTRLKQALREPSSSQYTAVRIAAPHHEYSKAWTNLLSNSSPQGFRI